MDKKDNLNKLKTVISSIEKSYGKGSIMMLGKKDEDMGNVDVYSTGSLRPRHSVRYRWIA